MYQIKATNGYEIRVIGKGENGLCEVADANGKTVKTGTYAECEKYLMDRAVKIIYHSPR